MRKRTITLLVVALVWAGSGGNCLASSFFDTTIGVSHHFRQDANQDAKDIELVATAGFRIIRYDMTWEQVERAKGIYDFSVYDRLVAKMETKGIRPLFILDYGNALYGEPLSARTPESRAAFARFAAAAVERYKGRNVMWEIWNEPNLSRFWAPKPNPLEYMLLVIEAALAMRLQDPDAYIVGGNVSGIDIPFLETCFKYGLLRYVDAVSVHPYRGQHPESALPEYEKMQTLIKKWQPYDKKVALVAGEWGYHTAATKSGRAEEEQARYLQRMMLVNAYAGSGFSIWYDLQNDGLDSKDGEHNFGLFRHDGTAKPAVAAVRYMTARLAGKSYVRRLPSSAEDFLLEFAAAKGKLCIVAWTTGKDHPVTLSTNRTLMLTQTPQFLD